MLVDINELLEKIHDVYESHNGGVIYLPKEKEEVIKKILYMWYDKRGKETETNTAGDK